MKRKMLVVSYYSPPYRSLFGVQRLAKFIKYFQRAGWNIQLLTSEPSESSFLDKHSDQIPAGVDVFRIPGIAKMPVLKGLGVHVPDDFFSWIRLAAKKLEKLILEDRPDVIMATVPPYSNAVVAAVAALKNGIPLITDFRDPWTLIDVHWTIRHRIFRKLNALMEARVLDVSHLCLIADEKKYLFDFFPNPIRWSDKIISVTNGYDEEDFSALKVENVQDGLFRLSYVGTFYDDETFTLVCKPLWLWAERFPEDMKHVRFVYCGASSHHFRSGAAIPCGLEDHGYVSHQTAMKLRMKSHLQLFAQPSYFKPHVYSGKIFEMIRTPVPILAITRTDSAPATLIRNTSTGVCVDHTDVFAAFSHLKERFEQFRTGNFSYMPRKEVVNRYSRQDLSQLALMEIERAIRQFDETSNRYHDNRSSRLSK